MNIKRSVSFSIVLAVWTVSGCNDTDSSRSEALERAKSTTPSLTATAPRVAPQAAKEPDAAKKAPSPTGAVPEAAPIVEPMLESQDGLVIRRLITAPGVEHREPVAASSFFERADEQVYAFLEVSNESSEGKALWVHFIGPNGQVSGGIELNIPASVPRWRTWAHTKHAKAPGPWRVEVRDVDGALLGALPFEVGSFH
jgi:hypothetical protein